MFKLTASALAAALILAPAALADEVKQVTLTHKYDAALLSTDEGASVILGDLEQATERLCTSRIPAYGGMYTDKACAEGLMASAVKEIYAAQTEAGVRIAPAFERVALTQLASAE